MHFKRIGDRLLFAVGTVVILGVIGIVVSYAIRQDQVMTRETELALTKTSESVEEGLAAVMLAKHARVAPDFSERLKSVPKVVDFRILRVDGSEAFIDNETVDEVNRKLGRVEFLGHVASAQTTQILAATDPALTRVRETGKRVFIYQVLPGGERLATSLGPILAQDGCQHCHDDGEKVRGVLKLTISLADLDADIQRTWQLSMALIAIALLTMVALIYWVAHRTVVSQIVDFSRAIESAAQGDLSVRLPAAADDELGHMAQSFNHMSDELIAIYDGLKDEQDKLNSVIQGADSGIVVTDAAQKVVLVNKAAERLLGKNEAQVVSEGFLALFDDPGWLAARLAANREEGGSVLREWQGRILSVQASTICNADGGAIGSAVLLRDVTEEKRLEAQLREQAITDALTGLRNRRHFDSVLVIEFKRWQRYGTPLSVMMLDVDHFKNFNDTHGHECGDRVLSSIGSVLRDVSRPAVIPCRYGGEEMVVVMPGVTQAAGTELAESLRLKIAALIVDGLQVTVSIGVAGVPGHAVASGEALLKLADAALYRAKQQGRNRVCAAPASTA
ncbi:MAG: diguanylate cyclase [Sulfuritalea sp.]|nr:diguanylate cyclase [Sulfuritalea sp.]